MTYSVAETVKYSGVCRSTIYKEIRSGRLAAFRPHGQERGIRIPAAAVDDWIREGTE
jgi:excisionase family DNA binding protein